MKSLNLIVSDKDDLDINISEELLYLSISWNNSKSENDSYLHYCISCFLSDVSRKCDRLKVLDLSSLMGYNLNNLYYQNLEELYLPDTQKSISFKDRRNLIKIRAKGAERVTLSNMPNLHELELGNNLYDINVYNIGITNINLPSNIKLNHKAIFRCNNIKKIEIKKGCFLDLGCIMECSNLEEITLPDDIYLISPRLFENCPKLRIINGGKNIKQIFHGAFLNCRNLEKIDFFNFYYSENKEYSDSASDWVKYFSRNLSLKEVLKKQEKYCQNLKKKDIKEKEKYIANIFTIKQENIGIIIRLFSYIDRWVIWSLTNNKFYISTKVFKTKKQFNYGDIISFTEINAPEIIFHDNKIIINRKPYEVDLNKVKKLNKIFISKEIEITDFINYFSPEPYEKIFKKTVDFVNGLDICSIINSYTIEEERYWISRPGRDDHEHYKRIAKSDFSDAYLNTLLPQENIDRYESGCRPWGASYYCNDDTEAIKKRKAALKNYSKTAHICFIIKDYFIERHSLENKLDNRYNIKKVIKYVNRINQPYKQDDRLIVNFIDGITIKDVLENKERFISFI